MNTRRKTFSDCRDSVELEQLARSERTRQMHFLLRRLGRLWRQRGGSHRPPRPEPASVADRVDSVPARV
jgi:hypothetical protein